MSELIIAIGLVFVIEGLLYAAFPSAMRKMIEQMGDLSDQSMRTAGLCAVALGVLIVWFVKG